MITTIDIFGPSQPFGPTQSARNEPIVIAQTEQPELPGWVCCLDWSGTAKHFFTHYCEKCGAKHPTPLVKDVNSEYRMIVRHCGREESITMGELLDANLPTIRTEPWHAGVIKVGDNKLVQVGNWDTADDEIAYEASDPAAPGKDWGGGHI
jgi:hypothetical protein